MTDNFIDQVKAEVSSTIGIDFDGVLHANSKGYHDGTIYGELIPGSTEALQFLSTKYKLIIYTCKAAPERPLVDGKTGTELIEEWLEKHQIDQYISGITNKKPRALFYIDDKVIRFTNNWAIVIDEVNKLEKEFANDISKF